MKRLWSLAVLSVVPVVAGAQLADYRIVGDGIPQSLSGKPGVAARGKALIARREAANCLECHSFKDKDLAGGGSKGPALDGVGAVLTPAQLRLSVVDIGRIAPQAGMPSFHTSSAGAPGGRLGAQEIEDIVAFLATLRK